MRNKRNKIQLKQHPYHPKQERLPKHSVSPCGERGKISTAGIPTSVNFHLNPQEKQKHCWNQKFEIFVKSRRKCSEPQAKATVKPKPPADSREKQIPCNRTGNRVGQRRRGHWKTFLRLAHTSSKAQPPPSSSSLGWLWRLMVLTLICEMPTLTSADWLMDCGDCHCKWNSGKKTADCKNLTLSSVPENLSNEVQVLDLSLNRIVYLEENAFLTADLTNLHKLYIRNSSLQHIDPRTFTQLEILIELDLSNNHLRVLQPNVFGRLVKVRAIVLNGNQLEALGDGIFQNLKYLHKIELKDNRLVKIANQVFVNVPLLSQIYLNNNRLNFLRKESFEYVKRLTALSLDGNPWNCTCELQIFRDFVLRRNLYTPPTACYYPAQLRGMLWIEDQPEAFACKPRIIFPAKGASISTSKENVTLVCRVHASANTHIAWDYNKQIYRSTSSNGQQQSSQQQQQQQQRVFIHIIQDDQSKEKEFGRNVYISRLTILGAEKSDEGIYTCIAENAGGKDSVQMSLLIQKPNGREMLQGNLAAVISLMALGLLSVSIFLAMVTCCIYKRFIASSASHHHRHHHLDLSGNDPLTSHGTVVANHGSTNVAGNTDVMLGVVNGLVSDGNIGGGGGGGGDTLKYKKHQQTSINGGSSLIKDKYTELLKHSSGNGGVVGLGGVGSGTVGSDITAGTGNSPLMESCGGGNGKKAISCDVQLGQMDKQYYEQHNNDDMLTIKYPHGRAPADVSGTLVTGSTGYNSSLSQSNDGLLNNMGTGDFQPDLLPAYASQKTNSIHHHHQQQQQHQHQSQQQDFMYSPVVTPGSTNSATKTINSNEDQQTKQQQLQLHQFTLSSSTNLPSNNGGGGGGGGSSSSASVTTNSRNKFNTSAQDYLQSKFGSISRKQQTKSQEKLSAAASGSLNLLRTSPVSEIQTRPTKSLFMPQRTVCSATTTATPTDTTSSYEYRQPPPPPYNAAHRTTGNLLLSRRTSFTNHHDGNSNEDNSRNSHTKDQGYRESSMMVNGAMSAISSSAAAIAASTLVYESTTARQTIVTASPSMSFPTTITGFNTNTTNISPRRQLL
ncbi:kekkon 4 [Haematobia irritans]|uniref:kekkon 4 n=1 Tax=Haematobia irritans TaxID=7368 RepID=UPI003F501108